MPLGAKHTLENKTFEIEKQEILSKYMLDVMNFDWNHGVLKTSEYPFTNGFTSKEVRYNPLLSRKFII